MKFLVKTIMIGASVAIFLNPSCKKPDDDTVAPQVTLHSPSANDTVRTNLGLTYTFDASDNTLVSQMIFRIRATSQFTFPLGWGVGFHDSSAVELVNQKSLVNASRTIQGLNRFATGNYTFTIGATDVDGNQRIVSPAIPLFFQNTADGIYPTISAMDAPASVSVGSPINFVAQVQDNRRLLRFVAELRNASSAIQTQSPNVSGTQQDVEVNFNTNGLTTGTYTIRLTATDSVFNITSINLPIQIN